MAQSENHSRRRFLGSLAAAAGATALMSGKSEAEGLMGPSKNKIVYQLNRSEPAYILDILHSAAVVL